MKEATLIEALRQASLGEIGEVFRGWVQEVTKEAVVSVMFQEVEELCGAFYHPVSGSGFKRGGSAAGRIVLNGVEEEVVRSRVRRVGGKGNEVRLLSYAVASPFFAGKTGFSPNFFAFQVASR